MTVTTNEYGQNNLFAKDSQMVVESYNRKGLESPQQFAETYNGRWAMMGIISEASSLTLSQANFSWHLLMENSLLEILTYYVIGGALLIGAPGVFFFIVFQPALQNTKGRMVGYKDHKTYGDSSIYENTPSDNSKFYLTL